MAIILNLSSTPATSDLAGLRAQVRSDFDFLTSDSEVDRLLNEAYLEICDDDWSFLEADAAGPSPLTIEDLRKVATVRDSSTGVWLERTSRQRIVTLDLDPSSTGTPQGYYIDGGITVRTYPVGGTLAVRYWRIPPRLTNTTDIPIIPERFRDVIVTGACCKAAMMDEDTNLFQNLSQEYDRRLTAMRNALMVQDLEADSILLVEHWYDG